MRRQLMAEQWTEFAIKVLPKDCSITQRIEMRRAFYAGAHSILFRLIASFAPESEPTEEDLKILEGIQNELQEFANAIQKGQA